MVLILVNNSYTRAAFQVAVGQEFNYDVLLCEQDLELGLNNKKLQGFLIDGVHFDQGTSVKTTVTTVSSTNVDFLLASGSVSETVANSMLGASLVNIFSSLHFIFLIPAYCNFNDWPTILTESEGNLGIYPFIDTDTSTWDDYVELADDFSNDLICTEPEFARLNSEGITINSDTEFYLEVFVEGTFNDFVEDGEETFHVIAEIIHHWQFIYNKDNGVLKGQRLQGIIDGTTNGSKLVVEYNRQVEIQGYNLPDYTFTSDDESFATITVPFIGTFKVGITLPITLFISTLTISYFIFKKKKLTKNRKE